MLYYIIYVLLMSASNTDANMAIAIYCYRLVNVRGRHRKLIANIMLCYVFDELLHVYYSILYRPVVPNILSPLPFFDNS